MTEPVYDPAQQVVASTVAEQAASVAPDTSSLAQAPQALVDAGAKPAEVDTAALLKQLQDLSAVVESLKPEPPAPPAPPARTSSQIPAQAGGWLHNVLNQLEDRIETLEGKHDES